MWLLDTNVISEFRKARPHPAVAAWLERQPTDSLFLSSATIGEIQRGAQSARPRNPEKAAEIEAWMDSLIVSQRILAADERVFIRWALLMERRPTELIVDALIAATAHVHGLTVATRNTRDFETLGVPTVNPFEG